MITVGQLIGLLQQFDPMLPACVAAIECESQAEAPVASVYLDMVKIAALDADRCESFGLKAIPPEQIVELRRRPGGRPENSPPLFYAVQAVLISPNPKVP